MTDEREVVPTPAGQPAGRPRGLQLAMVIVGGFILAFGGCLLLNTSAQTAPVLPVLFAVAFFVGTLMCIGGIIAAVIMGIAGLFKSL